MKVLGHWLQNDGGIRFDWLATKQSMWRAFWATAGLKSRAQLPLYAKLRLLSRSVLPILDFRSSKWPPQQMVAREMDQLQRKMVSILMAVRPLPLEDPVAYKRRRHRLASNQCRRVGLWSHR
eukprot:2834930-Alexandrium_andersonii.AAC.1